MKYLNVEFIKTIETLIYFSREVIKIISYNFKCFRYIKLYILYNKLQFLVDNSNYL